MSSRDCSSAATTTAPPAFESPRSFDSDRSSFIDIQKAAAMNDQGFTIVLPSNGTQSDNGFKSADSPVRYSGITTPTTSSSDGEYPLNQQNLQYSPEYLKEMNVDGTESGELNNGQTVVEEIDEKMKEDYSISKETENQGKNNTGDNLNGISESEDKPENEIKENFSENSELNPQKSPEEVKEVVENQIEPMEIEKSSEINSENDSFQKSPKLNSGKNQICTKESNSEVFSNEKNNCDVKIDDNEKFDTLNATIEQVALREREIARARKEAEEARNVQENEQSDLPAHLLNFDQCSGSQFTVNSPAGKQSTMKLVSMEECHSAPSTSAMTEFNSGLPSLEPVDTNFSQASTPLPTPSESSSTCSNKPKRRRRDRSAPAVFCEYIDPEKGQCKQRAILSFHHCIRHILADPEAPYKQCQHKRKPKNKKDEGIQCTNAIPKDQAEIYCTTHLIMNGMREPKKKKKADDVTSNVSVEGSDAYESVMTNNSNPIEDFSMNSFTDNAENNYGNGNQDFNNFDNRQGNWERPQQSFSAQGFESQPSTSFFVPDGQSRKLERQEFQEKTFQLIQKPNGEHVLLDDCGNVQPPESYSLIRQSDGSIQAAFHQPPIRQEQNSIQLNEPPQSAPPSFQNGIKRSEQLQENYQSVSLDGTPQKMFDQTPFPSSGGSCGSSRPESSDMTRQHPQLVARLLQPSSTVNNNQTITIPRQEVIVPQTSFNEVLVQQPDGSVIVQPIENQQIDSRPSSSSEIMSNLRTIVTFPDGSTQILPPGTQIIQTENGTTALVPPMSEQEQFQLQQQIIQFVDPLNSVVGNRAPYPFLPIERPPKYLKSKNNLDDDESEDEEKQMQKEYGSRRETKLKRDKMICLRQKRQRIRIGGSFRTIPAVDEMARMMEDHDFDKTDLFPLGLEPSDDEITSDEDMMEFGPKWWPSSAAPRNTALEIYLQKKVLKLEKTKLNKAATITAPLIYSAKNYPNSSGAALRTRDHYNKGLNLPQTKPFRERRCYHMQTIVTDGQIARRSTRCPKPCLPRTNHCVDHILYNIDQKLFIYCRKSDCSRPTLPSESILTDGLCRHHYEQQELIKLQDDNSEILLPPSRPSSARYIEQFQPTPSNVTAFDNSTTILSSISNQVRTTVNPFPGGSRNIPSGQSMIFEDKPNYYGNNDNFTEDDGDVSLASVAKDLGINSEALNEVLAQVGEEEPMETMDLDKDMDLGHNWADVEQFLLSEGYPVDPPEIGEYPEDQPGSSFQQQTNNGSTIFDSIIYNDFR